MYNMQLILINASFYIDENIYTLVKR